VPLVIVINIEPIIVYYGARLFLPFILWIA